MLSTLDSPPEHAAKAAVQQRVCWRSAWRFLEKTAGNPVNWWVAELDLGLYDGKAVLNVTLWAEKPGKD